MNDVNVKEAEVVRQYSAILKRFGESSLGNSKMIQGKLKEELNAMSSAKKKLELELFPTEQEVEYLCRRYDEVRSQVSNNNIPLIGETDVQAKTKLRLLTHQLAEINSKIKSFENHCQSISEKIGLLGEHILDLSSKGSLFLKNEADLIDQYKEL